MPMNPEWLPVLALLLAGIFVTVVALNALFTRRALRGSALLAAGVTTIAIALWIGRHHSTHWIPSAGLTPATRAPLPSPDDDSDSTSMSLRLGRVTLRIPVSTRYRLAAEGRRFLDLELDRRGLWVSCEVAGRGPTVRRNNQRYPSGPLPEPDPHTLRVEDHGATVLEVRYANPRSIEVAGLFDLGGRGDTLVVSSHGGIRWPGGGAPPGTTIDLRHLGKGTIEFERSGRIGVRR